VTRARKTVVFDVGGVIVRWQPLELMREHLPHVDAQEAFGQVFENWSLNSDWRDFDLGRVQPQALAERIARRTGYPRESIAAMIASIPAHLQPMAESAALIERVRAAGHRLAVLSNMPAPYADHLEAAHECFGWFEHRAWSGRLGMAKPERSIFDHVESALAIDDPSQLMFIDDHLGNVDVARACGWHAAHFRSAAQVGDDLRALGFL
jgi:putative hydrolase of the HAD superfamily